MSTVLLKRYICHFLSCLKRMGLLQAIVICMQLRLVPGRKGLRMALGDVPSWVAFQDKEKVEVRLSSLCPVTCTARSGCLTGTGSKVLLCGTKTRAVAQRQPAMLVRGASICCECRVLLIVLCI